MKFLILVCAGSDFSPPDTIGPETEAWVRRATTEAGRSAGGRLRPPEEAVMFGSDEGGVSTSVGQRVPDDEQIVGFDVIECSDLAAAVKLLQDHPMARAGRIELRAVHDGAP